MTHDELALAVLLDDGTADERRAKLAALAAQALQAIGGECPACHGRDVEDNGHHEYRCVACDHRWGGEA